MRFYFFQKMAEIKLFDINEHPYQRPLITAPMQTNTQQNKWKIYKSFVFLMVSMVFCILGTCILFCNDLTRKISLSEDVHSIVSGSGEESNIKAQIPAQCTNESIETQIESPRVFFLSVTPPPLSECME